MRILAAFWCEMGESGLSGSLYIYIMRWLRVLLQVRPGFREVGHRWLTFVRPSRGRTLLSSLYAAHSFGCFGDGGRRSGE